MTALGNLAFREERLADAAALLTEAETMLRQLDDRPLLADLLSKRGLVDLRRGDPAAAQAALSEAQQIAGGMNIGATSTLNRALERLRKALSG